MINSTYYLKGQIPVILGIVGAICIVAMIVLVFGSSCTTECQYVVLLLCALSLCCFGGSYIFHRVEKTDDELPMRMSSTTQQYVAADVDI